MRISPENEAGDEGSRSRQERLRIADPLAREIAVVLGSNLQNRLLESIGKPKTNNPSVRTGNIGGDILRVRRPTQVSSIDAVSRFMPFVGLHFEHHQTGTPSLDAVPGEGHEHHHFGLCDPELQMASTGAPAHVV